MRRLGSRSVACVVAVAVVGSLAATVTTSGRTASASGGYVALTAPQRLLDTRVGQPTADGQSAGIGRRTATSTLQLQVAGRVGLPADVSAVVLNVTVTEPTAAGFVTVFPCGQTLPTASNLNYAPGQTVPNAVIAKVGDGGRVCLYTLRDTHLVVDVSGWFPADAYAPLPAPRRLLDTRAGLPTFDGQFAGGGRRGDATTLSLRVAGRAGVPANATTVVLNVTATEPIAPGFVTVFPCGTRPNASNLNYGPGRTVPNLVVARVGPDGNVCLYTHRATHLVVDVSGTLPDATFVPLAAPQRLLDTRPGSDTADGAFRRSGAQPRGGTLQLRVGGRAGIPADASAVVLNVTVASPETRGFVTTHPRGTPRPTASNLNHVPGVNVPNAVVAALGAGGDICLFTSGATQLVVDVAGWLVGGAPPPTGAHCPSLTPTWSDADAIGQLVVRPTLHRVIGVDRVAVWACDLPGGSVAVDPVTVATWANVEVTPWFTVSSNGRFVPQFEAHPSRRVAANNPSACLNAARNATGPPYTNALVVGTESTGGGFGGPGGITDRPELDTDVLSRSPRDSRRGVYVGGGSFALRPDPKTFIHEMGHSIHWPHSFIGPSEYDNPLDMMSDAAVPFDLFETRPDAFCSSGNQFWDCKAQHTLAFNRHAAAWVPGRQVGIHRSGHVNYTLDRPTGPGVQFVAFPDPTDDRAMLTIEARPALGQLDQHLVTPGVAVHVVDQVPTGNAFIIDGFSTNRRHRQAMGRPRTYDHVIEVGSSATVNGVRISVLAAAGDGYLVTVSGTFRR